MSKPYIRLSKTIPPSATPNGFVDLIWDDESGKVATRQGNTLAPMGGGGAPAVNLRLGSTFVNSGATLDNDAPHLILYAYNRSTVIYLPAASGSYTSQVGKVIVFKNLGTGNMDIQAAGSDTIFKNSSVTSFTLTAGQSVTVQAVSSNQWVTY